MKSDLYNKKYWIRDIAHIMGVDDTGHSSNFYTFCKTNGSAGMTQDDDVTTIATTTSAITETTASNDTTQGTTHPDFKTSRPYAITN